MPESPNARKGIPKLTVSTWICAVVEASDNGMTRIAKWEGLNCIDLTDREA